MHRYLQRGGCGRLAGVAPSARLRTEVKMSPTAKISIWASWSLVQRAIGRARSVLPEGRPIPEQVWARRHDGIVKLVWLHAVGLLIATVLINPDHVEGYAGGLLVGLFGVLADRPLFCQRLRACLNALALLISSSVLVHVSGGVIEMHFHFFVALAVIAFYQDWAVFLVAIGWVLVEHAVTGVLFPTAVYNHPSAWDHPWLWAGIHAAFVAAASTANLLGWRVNEQQALHDPLTRLPNRALFRDRVEHALARARWRTQQVAVCFLDLDRFKPINDTYGHHVGDEVLIDIAGRLRNAVRAGDTVARLGGDEFAILLEDLDEHADVMRLARRIQEALREPIQVRGRPIPLRASLGIALSEGGAADVDALIRDADVAMYSAKKRGGGRSLIFEPSMRAGLAERLELEMELRWAITNEQLAIHYQPTVNLATGEIVGVEALLRWTHRTRGPISPSVFIPMAEECGLIVPIGRWVLERACEQARRWHNAFPARAPLAMSINVSPLQLSRDDFVQDVARTLRETGIAPGSVTLEITESALMEDTDASTAALGQLKALGVHLAIDDFGTGYSSLNYLQRMPIDILKIDRSFVDRIDQGGDELAFARAIVELARTLSLRTVAEGIELESQAECLDQLGCDLGQGFLYARAVPADEMTRLLASPAGPGLPLDERLAS
jgi:diguanylate cyclase (GGDEF)-like protein